MTFGLRITLLLLLATGTVTVKGLSTTVPTRGDGLVPSAGTIPNQGSSTTVSTTEGVSPTDTTSGGSSTTVSTTEGSSTTVSTTEGPSTTVSTTGGPSTTVSTTEGPSTTVSTTGGSSTTASTTTRAVTTTDCPPRDRLWHILQALFARFHQHGRRPIGGIRGGRPKFHFLYRYPRALTDAKLEEAVNRQKRQSGLLGLLGGNRSVLLSILLNNLNQDGLLSNLLSSIKQDGQLSSLLSNLNPGVLSSLLNNFNQDGLLSNLLSSIKQDGQLSSLLSNLNPGVLSSLLNNFNQVASNRRQRRGLTKYDLIRGYGGTSGPSTTKPTRTNDPFNLADALLPDDSQLDLTKALNSAEKPGTQDFQKNVLQKLDTINEEVSQLFRLLPRIMAQRSSK